MWTSSHQFRYEFQELVEFLRSCDLQWQCTKIIAVAAWRGVSGHTKMRAGGTHRLNRGRSAPVTISDQALEGPLNLIKIPTPRFILQCVFCIGSLFLGYRLTQEARLLGVQYGEDGLLGGSPTTPSVDYIFSRQNGLSDFDFESTRFDLHRTTPPPHLDHPSSRPNNNSSSAAKSTGVYVGRHPILIRNWPHPDPLEMMSAFNLIARVQMEQEELYGISIWKPIIAITPTYSRTFQIIHLQGLMRTLSLIREPVTWIVVEAGGVSNDTAALLSKAQVHKVVHLGFEKSMPPGLEDQSVMESHLRIAGLRYIRDHELEGIVVFADDSNVHSMNFFNAVQKVKWVGAIPIGILGHAGFRDFGKQTSSDLVEEEEGKGLDRDFQHLEILRGGPAQIQGPACDSSGSLKGWHSVSPVSLDGEAMKRASEVEEKRLEWAGFVLNARAVWALKHDCPNWIKDWVDWAQPKEGVFIDLKSIVRDEKQIEALSNCGQNEMAVLLWWARVEACADSKFPARWSLDSPLEMVVAAKSTPWPDRVLVVPSPPHLPSKRRAERRDGRPRHLKQRADATKSRPDTTRKIIVPDVRGHKQI